MKYIFLFVVLCGALFAQTNSKLNLAYLILGKDSGTVKSSESLKTAKKSVGTAILLSALLPGMGELYAGTFNSSGKYLTMAEGSFLVGYIGMNSYASWQRSNYKEFAKSRGGVNSASTFSDDYYADIGSYSDIKQFNDYKTLNGEFSKLYDSQRDYWSWGTESNRKEYRNMWVSAQHANNNLRFVVGAMLLNRLFSVINAVRSVVAYNKSLETVSENNFINKYEISAYQDSFNSLNLSVRYNF